MAITPSDFSKIWASNADTPEYIFSEADYLKGWDFVGNLPPTRAMWNAMQKSTDEKMKYVFNNFGAPLTASTVAEMTLQNRVYVYTGSETGYTAGHWYYWNGTAWVSGGVYNAVAFNTDTTLTISGAAADAKATGDRISELNSSVLPVLVDKSIRNISTTAGTSIGTDASKIEKTIPSGTTYYVKLSGDATIFPNGYNLYVNGSYKNGSRAVNTEYEYTADTNITNVSIYVVGTSVAKTGTLEFSIYTKTENPTSLVTEMENVQTILGDTAVSYVSRNIFNDSVLATQTGVTVTDGVYNGTATDLSCTAMENVFEADTQYTLSLQAYTDGNYTTSSNGLTVRFIYSDDTYISLYIPNNTSSYEKFTLTSESGKNVSKINFLYVSGGPNIWHVKDIQLEKGTIPTDYVRPGTNYTARDIVARESNKKIENKIPVYWFDEFNESFLRIAYSAIWVDKINTATHWLFASQLGFNALKGDVEITSDGKLIMCHDPGFTFDANGRITTYDSNNKTLIVNMTYAECRSKTYADNPARYGQYCPVADIDDFIKICKDKGKICFVTIRTTNTDDVIAELVDKIRFYNYEQKTIINALSATLLEKVRNNPLADNIAMNLVAPEGTVITREQVEKCVLLRKCFLTIWGGATLIANCTSVIDYAHSMGVPLMALANNLTDWNAMIEGGIVGGQVYKPLFDVDPFSYRFGITMSGGIPSFDNLLASGRYTGDVSISDNVVTVQNVKITSSYLTDVIDGIQPIIMNMLNPVIKCIDSNGVSVPITWANNAFKITLTTTTDETYKVIVSN